MLHLRSLVRFAASPYNGRMKLTDEDVREFCHVYKEAYGEEMPLEEARMWAIRLVRLYRILLAPTPSESAQLAKSGGRANLKPRASPAPAARQQYLPKSP